MQRRSFLSLFSCLPIINLLRPAPSVPKPSELTGRDLAKLYGDFPVHNLTARVIGTGATGELIVTVFLSSEP